jgi:ADP-L-glycero-D-manno-heptose 6-epimerase
MFDEINLEKTSPVLVTGGLGFIGTHIVRRLNNLGFSNVVVTDRPRREKWRNCAGMQADFIDADSLLSPQELVAPSMAPRFEEAVTKFMNQFPNGFKTIIHLGACSDTQEQDASYLFGNNYAFTAIVVEAARRWDARVVYASSAATYGDGSLGFLEGREFDLRPLNAYGWSKQIFDLWMFRHHWGQPRAAGDETISSWAAGVKFFNVYGPTEEHKQSMCSMIYRGLKQLVRDGEVRIFRGTMEMTRDFVHVDDAVNATLYLGLVNREAGGVFNVGSAIETSWRELAEACCDAAREILGVRDPRITLIDPPEGLMTAYQERTVANTSCLKETGFDGTPRDIIQGARDVAMVMSNVL